MIDQEKVIHIIREIGNKISKEKEYLTELDNVIGDGDHGVNLARGFAEVEKKLDSVTGEDIGAVLKMVGMTLVAKVGGASGPLYGTAFMKAGADMAGKREMDINDLLRILQAAIEGIMMRGKAVKGEKTMLDAMIPAKEAMEAADGSGKEILALGIQAAKEGVLYTKTIIATKGRASYLGERSIGHQDPGATSFTMMLEVIQSAI